MPSNATIYLADNSLLGSKFLKRYPQIESYEEISDGESAVGLRLQIPGAIITMSFMPTAEVGPHLLGLAGYSRHTHQGSEDDLVYVLARIHEVRYVIGCVVEPEFDEAGDVEDFLVRFASGLNGLLFIWDSIIDYDGDALLGPLAQHSNG